MKTFGNRSTIKLWECQVTALACSKNQLSRFWSQTNDSLELEGKPARWNFSSLTDVDGSTFTRKLSRFSNNFSLMCYKRCKKCPTVSYQRFLWPIASYRTNWYATRCAFYCSTRVKTGSSRLVLAVVYRLIFLFLPPSRPASDMHNRSSGREMTEITKSNKGESAIEVFHANLMASKGLMWKLI